MSFTNTSVIIDLLRCSFTRTHNYSLARNILIKHALSPARTHSKNKKKKINERAQQEGRQASGSEAFMHTRTHKQEAHAPHK